MPQPAPDLELLFTLYKKHDGRLTNMAKDPVCPINTRQALGVLKKKENWADRYEEEKIRPIERDMANRDSMLDNALYDIAAQAKDLIPHCVTGSELFNLFKILRLSRGLPTSISQSANFNLNLNKGPKRRSLEDVKKDLAEFADSLGRTERRSKAIDVGTKDS